MDREEREIVEGKGEQYNLERFWDTQVRKVSDLFYRLSPLVAVWRSLAKGE